MNKLALGQDLTISYLGRLTRKRDLIRSYDLNLSMKAKKMELAGWPRFKVRIEKGDVQHLFCNSQSSNAGGLHILLVYSEIMYNIGVDHSHIVWT